MLYRNMELLDDAGFAIGLSLVLFGLALGLPNINLGIFGLDFSKFSPTILAVIRLGIIAIAITIGLKPLEKQEDEAL